MSAMNRADLKGFATSLGVDLLWWQLALVPRKEDYCEQHDWLLKKGCAECADERRASA